MAKKLLPVGIANFSEIRGGNYYYVDKTPLIIELLTTSKCAFLSRPRRFGKSLTIDTIAELYAGNKELFKGLYAENHWDWEDTYPVIRLSFAGETIQGNFAKIEKNIHYQIRKNAQNIGVMLDSEVLDDVSLSFNDLIFKTRQKYQKQVVVLIDEYDKPILDNLPHRDIALQVRALLKSLYSQLKDAEAHIRFAMLTGVSKFGQVSVFSGLNHLLDVSLHSQYSALCGYTQTELEEVFAPELVDVDLAELRHWYNGYNWTGESVYNPFDILLFFYNNKNYQAYWMETGGNASFLLNLLQTQNFNITQIGRAVDSNYLLSSMDIGSLEPIPILFQTGYLTIDQKIRNSTIGTKYRLKFPNVEVRLSLNNALLKRFLQHDLSYDEERLSLLEFLQQGNLEGVQQIIKSLFAAIPHDWHRKNNIAHYEGYWASVFYMLFASSCSDIRLEDATDQGRIDMTIIENDNVYIFEFKMKHQGGSTSALQQIQEKDYKTKYQATAKAIYQIGVGFDEKTREIEFEITT